MRLYVLVFTLFWFLIVPFGLYVVFNWYELMKLLFLMWRLGQRGENFGLYIDVYFNGKFILIIRKFYYSYLLFFLYKIIFIYLSYYLYFIGSTNARYQEIHRINVDTRKLPLIVFPRIVFTLEGFYPRRSCNSNHLI